MICTVLRGGRHTEYTGRVTNIGVKLFAVGSNMRRA